MTIELIVKSSIANNLAQEIIRGALRSQAELARFRYEQFFNECIVFERRFAMSSDEFLRRFNAGELDDAEEYFDWFAATRGREVWQQKAQVLAEVAM